MFSAADADLKRQQDEFKNSCDALEAKIKNPATGQVAKGQAVQQVLLVRVLMFFVVISRLRSCSDMLSFPSWPP